MLPTVKARTMSDWASGISLIRMRLMKILALITMIFPRENVNYFLDVVEGSVMKRRIMLTVSIGEEEKINVLQSIRILRFPGTLSIQITLLQASIVYEMT